MEPGGSLGYITTVVTVKNKYGQQLGPAPVRSGPVDHALSGQRAVVLERLEQGTSPTPISTLADDLGLHTNTVREHLDALVALGLAMRDRAPASGRGRPAWLYAAVLDRVEPDVRLRDYAGLTGALAAHLQRTSPDPGREAQEIGQTWGRELAADPPDSSTADPSGRVVALLAGLGFAPEADAAGTTAALRRCPLLDVARAHPEVVCNVHLGIVQGALEAYGGDAEPVAMEPFAEPGACRLHLTPARSTTAIDP